MDNKRIQDIAKETIEYIKKQIVPGMNLKEIRYLCEEKMIELGADSFWYYDIGAFCFAGEETTTSVSGKRYQTSNRVIRENDIITIDLSPQYKNIWGDYARTIIIEDSQVVQSIEHIYNKEWKKGLLMEEMLHQELKEFVTMETTFEDLYYYMNKMIISNGYINLDFAGNLGHSIVSKQEDRIYIEKGNKTRLSDVDMFTFEPHIAKLDSLYGFKKENIYFIEEKKLKEL